MRTKMVKRHWCDFCDKAGLSASAMARHEKHCTMNPNRACRVCGMVADGRDSDFVPQTVAQLSALLPEPITLVDDFGGKRFQDGFEDSVNAAIPTLRAASGDCPACMMAALRQAKIPVPCAAPAFDFTTEMKEIWSNINDARESDYAY